MALNKKAASYAGIITLLIFGGIAVLLWGFLTDPIATMKILGIIILTIMVLIGTVVTFVSVYDGLDKSMKEKRASNDR